VLWENPCLKQEKAVRFPEIENVPRFAAGNSPLAICRSRREPLLDNLITNLVATRTDRWPERCSELTGLCAKILHQHLDCAKDNHLRCSTPASVDHGDSRYVRRVEQDRHAVSALDDQWQATLRGDQGISIWYGCARLQCSSATVLSHHDGDPSSMDLPTEHC